MPLGPQSCQASTANARNSLVCSLRSLRPAEPWLCGFQNGVDGTACMPRRLLSM